MNRGEDPTERLPEERAGEPTRPLPGSGSGDPTEPLLEPPTEPAPTRPPATGDDGRRLGYLMLAASVLAALVLCGAYIGLGGLDYRPGTAADPCDPRPWGSPQGVEETAERFSLAAIDGAACELGVSREELTRALAGESSRRAFAEDHGLTDTQVEDAVRSGLLRAADDAERGGSLSPLAATGARLAIKVMPMSVMVELFDNATTLFEGGSLGGAGGALGGALDLLGPTGSEPGGSGGNPDGTGSSLKPEEIPGRLGGELTDRLKQELPEDVQQALPPDLSDQVEKGLNDLIKP
ncbi:MAG: hypothetical protein M9938_02605 [Solirubrobacterales bacterium]|nr:hypothetical protein [Solirubrobacterales bacterium]